MKLLLTSIYVNVADELLKLIKDKPENITVAFIPTASDPYEDKWFVEVDKNKLKEQGFRIREIDLKSKNYDELKEDIKDCGVIFVGGGNVFYLLQEARKSGFDKVMESLINTETVYVGSSAGSVLLAPNIEVVDVFDDPKEAPELSDYTGLGLVDFLVLPHYGKEKYEEKFKGVIEKAFKLGLKTKTLGDDEFLII